MINKIISSFFFGLMLILPLDFLLFIGLKKYYFDFYKIDIYFNIYFVDNQPFLVLFISSFILGFFILYTPIRKLMRVLYVLVLLAFTILPFNSISNQIGKKIFVKKDLKCKLKKVSFNADLLYKSRKHYYLKKENKTIKILKEDLTFK